MKHPKYSVLARGIVCALALAACSGGSEGDSSDDAGDAGAAPPAEFTCDDWRDIYCTVLGSCTSTLESDCRETVASIECASDAELDRCVPALESAVSSCEDLPSECGARDVADRTEAVSACETYKVEFCEWFVPCNPGYTQSSCLAEVDGGMRCEDFYGVRPGFDQCLSDLDTAACSPSVPESCSGVLISEF